MATFDQVFRQIPKGCWWVRWLDHVTTVSQANRLIHVTLSRLTDPRHARTVPSDTAVVQMTMPYIASFSLGDIFDDRRLRRSSVEKGAVASVCDTCEDGADLSFEFDATAFGLDDGQLPPAASGSSLDAERPGEPAGSDEGEELSILSEGDYPGLASRSSRVLVVTSTRSETFLIPSAELLRALVAPQPVILTRLFRQSLDAALKEVVEDTRADANGSFRVTLGPGFDGRHGRTLAHLLKGYNAVGHAAAARLHPSLCKPDESLTAECEHPREGARVAANSSTLPAVMPFGAGVVGIRGKGFRLGRDRFLVAKITRVEMPMLSPLRVVVPRDRVDPSFPRNEGSGSRGRPSAAAGSDRELDLVGEPGPTEDPVQVDVEQVFWTGGAQVEVVEERRPRRPVQGSGPAGGSVRPPTGAALGDVAPGGPHKHAEADHSGTAADNRFVLTIKMLDRLKPASIRGYGFVLPPDGRGTKRGGLDLWTWPKGMLWTTLEPQGRPPRPRTMMVLRIFLETGTIHWLSAEVSGEDTRSALLVLAGAGPKLDDVVDAIAEYKGSARQLEKYVRMDEGRAAAFVHRLTRDEPGPGQKPDDPRLTRLDERPALEAFERLLTPRA